MTDERRVHRIYVEILATDEQASALHSVIGEALCAAPEDHDGPCRVAWSMGQSSEQPDEDQEGSSLSLKDVASIRDCLGAVEVWPREEVDRSLGIGR